MRNRNLRIYLCGQALCWTGSMVQSVAQGWLVWSLTRSAAYLVLTAVMISLPQLLFALPAGALADRFDRRRLLLVTQGAAILPALVLGVLAYSGKATPALVLLLALLQWTVNALESPARHALLSELVPLERLGHAVAANAVSFNAARLVGPVVAGFVIASSGTPLCFFLNAISYLAGIAALLAVRPHRRAEPGRPLGTGDIREGILFLHNHGELRRLLFLVGLVSLLGIPFVPLLPVFADTLRVGAKGLGAMSACAGGGSLLAALVLACTTEIRGQRSVAELAALVFAAALLTLARSASAELAMASLFLAGGALVTFLALANTLLQKGCPDAMRGRVMGVYAALLLGIAPIGHALMGLATSELGAARALSLSASVCVVSIALAAASRLASLPAPFPTARARD